MPGSRSSQMRPRSARFCRTRCRRCSAAAPTSRAAPAPMPASMRGVSRSASAILAKCRCRKSCPRSTPTCRRDIRAVDIRSVPDGFHARYAAHAKTYRYYILNARVDDPFTYDTCHRVGAALDLAAMQAAAAQFIGTHDFSALCASGSSAAAHGDTVRTITDCTVVQNGDLFTISVTADGYLYNMVRILAGTLADAGLGKRTPGEYPRPAGKRGPTPGRADAARKGAVFGKGRLPGIG